MRPLINNILVSFILLKIVLASINSPYVPIITKSLPSKIWAPSGASIPYDLSSYFIAQDPKFQINNTQLILNNLLTQYNLTSSIILFKMPETSLGTWNKSLPAIILLSNNTLYWSYFSQTNPLPSLDPAQSYPIPDDDVICSDALLADEIKILVTCYNPQSGLRTLYLFNILNKAENQVISPINSIFNPACTLSYYNNTASNKSYVYFTSPMPATSRFEIFSLQEAQGSWTLSLLANLSYFIIGNKASTISAAAQLDGMLFFVTYNHYLYVMQPKDENYGTFSNYSFSLPSVSFATINPFYWINEDQSALNVGIASYFGDVFIMNLQNLASIFIDQYYLFNGLQSYKKVLGCSQSFMYVLDTSNQVIYTIDLNSGQYPEVLSHFNSSLAENYFYVSIDLSLNQILIVSDNQTSLYQLQDPYIDLSNYGNSNITLSLSSLDYDLEEEVELVLSQMQSGSLYEAKNSFLGSNTTAGMTQVGFYCSNCQFGLQYNQTQFLSALLLQSAPVLVTSTLEQQSIVFNLFEAYSTSSEVFWISQISNMTIFLSKCTLILKNNSIVCDTINSLNSTSSISEAAILISTEVYLGIVFANNNQTITIFNESFAILNSYPYSGSKLYTSPAGSKISSFYAVQAGSIAIYQVLSASSIDIYNINSANLGLTFSAEGIYVSNLYPDIIFVQTAESVLIINVALLPKKTIFISEISTGSLAVLTVSNQRLVTIIQPTNQMIYYDISNLYKPIKENATQSIITDELLSSGSEFFYSLAGNTLSYYSFNLPDPSFAYGTLPQISSLYTIFPTFTGDIIIYSNASSQEIQAELLYYSPMLAYTINESLIENEITELRINITAYDAIYSQKISYFSNKSEISFSSSQVALSVSNLNYTFPLSSLMTGSIQDVIKMSPKNPNESAYFTLIPPVAHSASLTINLASNEIILDGYQSGNMFQFLTYDQSIYQIISSTTNFLNLTNISRQAISLPNNNTQDWNIKAFYGSANDFVIVCEDLIAKLFYVITSKIQHKIAFDSSPVYSNGRFFVMAGKVKGFPTVQFLTPGSQSGPRSFQLPLGNQIEIVAVDIVIFNTNQVMVLILDLNGFVFAVNFNLISNLQVIDIVPISLNTAAKLSNKIDARLEWIGLKGISVISNPEDSSYTIDMLVYQEFGRLHNVIWHTTSGLFVKASYEPYPGYNFIYESISYQASNEYFTVLAKNYNNQTNVLIYGIGGEFAYNFTTGAFPSEAKYTSSEFIVAIEPLTQGQYKVDCYYFNQPAITVLSFEYGNLINSEYIVVEVTSPSAQIYSLNISLLLEDDSALPGWAIALIVIALAGLLAALGYYLWKLRMAKSAKLTRLADDRVDEALIEEKQ